MEKKKESEDEDEESDKDDEDDEDDDEESEVMKTPNRLLLLKLCLYSAVNSSESNLVTKKKKRPMDAVSSFDLQKLINPMFMSKLYLPTYLGQF